MNEINDLISRTETLELFIRKCCGECSLCDYEEKEIPYYCGLIKSVPTVDATPVVYGQWIVNKYGQIVCSQCNSLALETITGCLANRHLEPYKSKFCPECGAKMEREK